MRTTAELKKEIITKFENGVRVSDLAAQHNMAKSTIESFLSIREEIKASDVAKGVMFVHSKQIVDEVEKLLVIWIKEKRIGWQQ